VAYLEPGAELVAEFEALFEDPDAVAWIDAHAIAIRLVGDRSVRMGGERSWVSWQPSLTVVMTDGESFTRIEDWRTPQVMEWLKACQTGFALDDMRAIYTPDEAEALNQVVICQMLFQQGKYDECAERLLAIWDRTVVAHPDPQWDTDFPSPGGNNRMQTQVMTGLLLTFMNRLDHPSRLDPFFERLVKLEISLRNGTRANDPTAWDDWVYLADGLSLTERAADLLLARGEPMQLSEWNFNSRNGSDPEHYDGPSGYLRDKLYDWALADPRQLEVIALLPDLNEYAGQTARSLKRLLEKPEKTPDDTSLTGRVMTGTKWLLNQGENAQEDLRQSEAEDATRALARAWASCILDKREADAQVIAQSFGQTTDSELIRAIWFDEAGRWTDVPSELPFPPYGVRRDP